MNITRIHAPPALAGTLAVLRLLPSVSRSMTVALAAGIAAQTALPLGFIIVTGQLVGSVPAAVRDGIDSSAGHHTLFLLAAAALLTAVQRVLTSLDVSLASVFGRRLDRTLQERVMAAIGRPAEISHLEDPATLNLIETAQGVGTQDTKPGTAVASLASLLPSWLQALGSAVILMTFRWWLGLGWLLLWPVVLYYLQREYVRVGEAASGEALAVRRAGYLRDLALTPPSAKEVRIWGLPAWLISRFETAWTQAMTPIWRARKPGRAVVWISAVVVALANLAAFGLLADAAAHGHVALGSLAIYVQAIVAASSFRAFDDQNMNLAYAAVAVPSLLELERRLAEPAGTAEPAPTGGTAELGPTAIDRAPTAVAFDHVPTEPAAAIRFDGIRFRYPGNTADTLTGIDLEIPAGRSVAIVGANGAGKTTLVKLLCRLYDPTAGRITVDGTDLARLDPAIWQRQIAAIFQDFTRYHLPARDNIALGALDLAGDQPRICAAAAKAGALEIVESLPHGWDTVLSRQYSGGSDLSGGQWQRIALARALFAVEVGARRVLILDEPTANLDVRAEAELYDRFLEITAGLTTILISHRFSTVRRADHIVVLEHGEIVERGTHDTLVAHGGLYAEMFRLQAERFVEQAV